LSNTPPKRPWKKGKRPEYLCSILEMKVVENSKGWVFSDHDFQTPEDAAVANSMRGHGVRQIAFALMTEALRREAYLCCLAELSKDLGFVTKYKEATESTQREMEQALSNAALAVVMGEAQKMLPNISREILTSVSTQADGTKKDSSE